jgi:hypothetical protein
MTTYTLNNIDDIIDICDIIERYEELETELEGLTSAEDAAIQGLNEEWKELESLSNLLEDLKGNGGDEKWRGDWYTQILIRESYFEEYMDDLVYECYEVPKNLPSFMSITLDYVALQMDYTSTEIDGVTYFYR